MPHWEHADKYTVSTTPGPLRDPQEMLQGTNPACWCTIGSLKKNSKFYGNNSYVASGSCQLSNTEQIDNRIWSYRDERHVVISLLFQQKAPDYLTTYLYRTKRQGVVLNGLTEKYKMSHKDSTASIRTAPPPGGVSQLT